MIGLFEIWMMTTNGILALLSMIGNYMDRVHTMKAEEVTVTRS